MDFEKLGAFYLGKEYDPDAGAVTDDLLLYDAKDLTTHAVCVGMTGSGKTGLCLSLLEEAAIDGIPTIAIDPKGDLGNLLLTFPELRPQDFEPWVDPGEAARKGNTPAEHAAKTAALWKKGIGQWGQEPSRIAAFREAVDLTIYTPGSQSGIPLSVLRSFAAPPAAVLEDADLFRDRLTSAVSGLLALLGIDADPLQSREHIFLSNLLQHAWQEGRDLDIAGLIREIQAPPFDRIGVMELDTFYPSKDRFGLSMTLNNLLASPGFATWLEGDPLDVGKLLWTPEGKPRISIISIAHLNDQERMFVVTLVLNEVLAWIRSQAGTTSLRALLYMDEVFGYFPPSKNPPSKTPMLTLLKQARAFGLGVVLATQNPVDLDYKGLSNTGTWFLGRLQTERDKLRVLDGLEGASSTSGAVFDRARIETILSGLGSRVFLMNNVHDDAPVLFHTRWALSYLRGPLTRGQIQTLMDPKRAAAGAEAAGGATDAKSAAPGKGAGAKAGAAKTGKAKPGASAAELDSSPRPLLPPDIGEGFLPRAKVLTDGDRLMYRPGLMAEAKLHFVDARSGLDDWVEENLLVLLPDDPGVDLWADVQPIQVPFSDIETEGEERGSFADLPSDATKTKSYPRWAKMLKTHLYQTRARTVWSCKELKAKSLPGESEGEFRGRLSQLSREKRDLAVAKLEKKYTPKLATLQDRIRRASGRVEKEESQYSQQKLQTGVSLATTVLGALFGRKTAGKAATTIRGAGRAARERGDIGRAKEEVAAQEAKLAALEEEFQLELQEVRELPGVETLDLTTKPVRPRKADLSVDGLQLVWTPWKIAKDGSMEPAYE